MPRREDHTRILVHMPLPPLGKDEFARSHGLGNDYLVMDPGTLSKPLTPERIRLICHRNLGERACHRQNP